MGIWIGLSQQTVAHMNYSIDQPAVHGRLIYVWARVYSLNDRDQTAPRAIPICSPPPELRRKSYPVTRRMRFTRPRAQKTAPTPAATAQQPVKSIFQIQLENICDDAGGIKHSVKMPNFMWLMRNALNDQVWRCSLN